MRPNTGFTMFGFVALMLVLNAMTFAQSQEREQYVISAKAGGVNLVSGDVTLKRRDVPTWQPLTSQDDLDSGDAVRTGASGRVEMLLNPGSYLRAAENSEFELTSASLETLSVKLVTGNAIVEVAGADEARTLIEVITPQTKVVIDRKGVYRINLAAGDATEVLVYKGRAMIGVGSSLTELKDGKKIIVGGGRSDISKFEKKEKDAFAAWSEQRAEALVAANRRLSNSVIARSYGNYSRSGVSGLRGYRSSGFWIYDPFFRGRTFLPFYTGWSSPYGHSYSHGFGFHWHGRSYSPFYIPGGFGRSGGHNSRHRSDHYSTLPHSGRVHHQSTTHRSSPHHRRGH